MKMTNCLVIYLFVEHIFEPVLFWEAFLCVCVLRANDFSFEINIFEVLEKYYII